MRGRYVGDFLPFHRREIVYRVRGYRQTKEPTRQGLMRAGWIRWFEGHRKNAALTSRHFGISRKTFYKWLGRYRNAGIGEMEERSRAPVRRRQPEITPEQEVRIIQLRKANIRYGKEKLRVLYRKQYRQDISSWKIYRVIRNRNLYWHPDLAAKLRASRKRGEKKRRITELRNQPLKGMLFQMDTKDLWLPGQKRHIFTAVEKTSKIGFARMYTTCSSRSGKDFLMRLHLLMEQKIVYTQSDNGSEFLKDFAAYCAQCGIQHYFSRVRTPNDHAEVERFNRTLKEEFLQLGNVTGNVEIFNGLLTDWLIKYNFIRPHQTLGYRTPIEFLQEKATSKVLPMYPTPTYT